jgi:predicted AAA+ superfamily ATPase
MFGAVLVTGARQVGKTTLLSSAAGGADYVTLDDPLQRAAAGERGGTLRATRTGAF